MEGIFSFIKNVIFLVVAAVVLYVGAFYFNLLPKEYTPLGLFPDQYLKFKKSLLADSSSSDSKTAGLSKKLYTFLDDKEKPVPEAKEEPGVAEEIVNTITAPINKAKEGVKDIEDAMQKQKEELDKI